MKSKRTKDVLIDLTGQRFGKWYVISRAKNKGKRVMWNCKCDCGNVKIVQGTSLKNGVSTNCGCSKNHYVKHGQSDTRLYKIWQRMKGSTRSITHQDYDYYGGRGIDICDLWYDCFENFYNWSLNNGYDNDLEIDRIDNDGNYEPNNCRWVTRLENINNRRNTIFITLNGVTKPLSVWCDELNLSYGTIYARIFDYGWSEELALTTEVIKQ